jgi:uncharacterized membrane protein (GlpM family)
MEPLRHRHQHRYQEEVMTYLVIKAVVSGLIIAIVSEVSRKAPALGALIVSLPLVSLLAMMWLWNDTQDTARLADHAQATFWYVLPSLPMFLVLPWLLRAGYGFWPALAGVCVMTIALYALMVWALARFGISL